jgi:hypothetical protein
VIHLDTLRALHEHDHKLAAYCATCARWAVLDLDRRIANGRGDYCFVGRNPRFSYCKSPGRQARQAAEIGTRIRRGLSKHAARRTRRQPMYLFSGLLVCGVCGSTYTMRDTRSYACAGRLNGRACSNRLAVRRELVEAILLAEIKQDLSDPAIVNYVCRELTRRLQTKAPKVDRRRCMNWPSRSTTWSPPSPQESCAARPRSPPGLQPPNPN